MSLLLSAYQPQQTTVPESHVWQASDITPNGATYMFNKQTGEVYYLLKGIKKVAK